MMHYVLKFMDECDVQTQHAVELEVAPCYAVSYYADVIDMRTCFVDETKSNFQQALRPNHYRCRQLQTTTKKEDDCLTS